MVKFQVFPLLPISHQILVRSHAIFVRFSLNRTLKKGRQKVFLRAGFAENTCSVRACFAEKTVVRGGFLV